MKCIALDDEPLALAQMSGYIRRTGFLELSAVFPDASSASEWLESNDTDLIFADINMPGVNGLDFVRSLKRKPLVVFTTAYDRYAVEGFRVDATDYLLKPIGYADFLRAAGKAYGLFRLMRAVSEPAGNGTVFVKSDHRLVPIETDKILYIASRSEYVKIFTETSKPVMTLGSLKSWEVRLSASPFMRIHRSYIVNLQKISSVGRRGVTLTDGTPLPIGDLYMEAFKKYLSG